MQLSEGADTPCEFKRRCPEMPRGPWSPLVSLLLSLVLGQITGISDQRTEGPLSPRAQVKVLSRRCIYVWLWVHQNPQMGARQGAHHRRPGALQAAGEQQWNPRAGRLGAVQPVAQVA